MAGGQNKQTCGAGKSGGTCHLLGVAALFLLPLELQAQTVESQEREVE
jgi:hypothetical protein